MSDVLFERYKDALRRGHIAALGGALDDAIAAYREAATIAPDRSVPLTSLGAVLHRLEREDDALRAYEDAIERAPADVVALAGRATTLIALARPAAATDAYLALAELHEREDRPADASEAARRALELAGHREPRGSVVRIMDRFRGGSPDPTMEAAIARAQRILSSVSTAPAADEHLASPPGTAPAEVSTGPIDSGARPAIEQPPPAAPAQPLDPLVSLADAEVRLDAGDAEGAVDAYLAAAAVFGADHRWRAAVDACGQALAIAPTSGRLHLDLAELYLAAGWTGLAAQKLRLVARLADLEGDRATSERLCGIVKAWLSDDPVLAALCP